MKKIWYSIREWFHIVDKWLLFMWLFASGASLLFLYGTYNSGLSVSSKLVAQVAAIGIGLVAAIVLSMIEYNTLLKLWKLYVPVCVILVLLTFTSLGITRGGDRAWLAIPFVGRSYTLQPSEFLKISFITTFSMHISKVREHLNEPLHMLLLCAHGGIHVLLIQLQGDGGTALIFFIIFLIMIFCAGINWKYMAAAVVAVAAALPILWLNIMTEDQKMRILIMFNPERDPDMAYQQARSAIALGVGGVQGTGILAGRHVAVPEVYNDFIFAFIGESSGFMGCLGVIILLAAIAFKIFYNANLAKDDVGRFICIGVFAMIVAQTLVNLGMCIGILPVIGVTLPLFSAGGTSVLSLYAGLGLVLSVYCHSNTALFYENRR